MVGKQWKGVEKKILIIGGAEPADSLVGIFGPQARGPARPRRWHSVGSVPSDPHCGKRQGRGCEHLHRHQPVTQCDSQLRHVFDSPFASGAYPDWRQEIPHWHCRLIITLSGTCWSEGRWTARARIDSRSTCFPGTTRWQSGSCCSVRGHGLSFSSGQVPARHQRPYQRAAWDDSRQGPREPRDGAQDHCVRQDLLNKYARALQVLPESPRLLNEVYYTKYRVKPDSV